MSHAATAHWATGALGAELGPQLGSARPFAGPGALCRGHSSWPRIGLDKLSHNFNYLSRAVSAYDIIIAASSIIGLSHYEYGTKQQTRRQRKGPLLHPHPATGGTGWGAGVRALRGVVKGSSPPHTPPP